MRSRVLLRVGAAAVLCGLAGCRTAPVTFPAVAPWEVRRPQLQAREHFDLSGRVAVATGHEGFNANLHWEQQGRRSQLMLEGPLGTGAVRISASGNDLDIVTARGAPVASPPPHPHLPTLLRFGPPQAGWHIDYSLYVAGGGESLPARLTLQRDAVRVRLLVDDWQL